MSILLASQLCCLIRVPFQITFGSIVVTYGMRFSYVVRTQKQSLALIVWTHGEPQHNSVGRLLRPPVLWDRHGKAFCTWPWGRERDKFAGEKKIYIYMYICFLSLLHWGWRNQHFSTLSLDIFSDKQPPFFSVQAHCSASFREAGVQSAPWASEGGKVAEILPGQTKGNHRTWSKEQRESNMRMSWVAPQPSWRVSKWNLLQENLHASTMELEGRMYWVYLIGSLLVIQSQFLSKVTNIEYTWSRISFLPWHMLSKFSFSHFMTLSLPPQPTRARKAVLSVTNPAQDSQL